MCGIFGYVGSRNNAAKVVFEGLKRLEYRGYDSWGIVSLNQKSNIKNQNLIIEKHTGKIANSTLNSKLSTLNSNLALGHTRWATHGGVTNANAHPHLDCKGKIAVVHNGIIENFHELKRNLIKKGHKFKSETDTEVFAHLVEDHLKDGLLREVVRKASLKLKGLNAVVVLVGDELVAFKNGSPLVIGLSKKGNFIASDPSAIIPYTKRAVFLDDGDLAEIKGNKVKIIEIESGRAKKLNTRILDWEVEEVNLGKYKHFMLKEINEQPKVLRAIAENGRQVEGIAKVVESAHGTFFVACGSASYAALSGTYLFSKIAKKHVNYSIGSEFNYLEDYIDKGSLVIPISQSGESIDVIEPVVLAKRKGAKIAAFVNVQGSTLYRAADYSLLLKAGPEKAVCATKSWTAMVANLIYLAYTISGRKSLGKKIIQKASKGIEQILKPKYQEKINKLAKRLSNSRDIYVIGRGLSYPTALEAALKLKEVSYIHSEGFAGGELKHGVIALIEKGTPCVVFAPQDETYDDIVSNAIEIKARGGYIIGISPINNEVFDYYLSVSDVGEGSVIVDTVPIQLLTYFIALERGFDPDKPRNLAKSVTVK